MQTNEPTIIMFFAMEHGDMLAAMPLGQALTVEGGIGSVEKYTLSLMDCRVVRVGTPG